MFFNLGLGPGFPLGLAFTDFVPSTGFGPGLALGLGPVLDLAVAGVVEVVADGFEPGFSLGFGPGFPLGFTVGEGIFDGDDVVVDVSLLVVLILLRRPPSMMLHLFKSPSVSNRDVDCLVFSFSSMSFALFDSFGDASGAVVVAFCSACFVSSLFTTNPS